MDPQPCTNRNLCMYSPRLGLKFLPGVFGSTQNTCVCVTQLIWGVSQCPGRLKLSVTSLGFLGGLKCTAWTCSHAHSHCPVPAERAVPIDPSPASVLPWQSAPFPRCLMGSVLGFKQNCPVEQETKCSCLEAATVETQWCK